MKKILFIFLVSFIISCTQKTVQDNNDRILYYGNNVYYFDYVGIQFCEELSLFLENNPELLIVSMFSDERLKGTTNGYGVIFEKIQAPRSYDYLESGLNNNKITFYDNGIFYFDYVEEHFLATLSNIIKDNPKLKLLSVTADNKGDNTTGYIVVFKGLE